MGVTAAIAAVAGAGYSIYSGERANSKQNEAQQQALSAQAANESKADQEMNRANPKKPDTSAVVSQLQQAAKGGASGTLLTGPSGVDPSTLQLGKSTLLGS